MKEKLPKVFANKITKTIKNNEKIYTSNPEENIKTQSTNQNNNSTNIEKKIFKILNSREYMYKIPVKIETTTEKMKTTIIGKNKKNLITLDNKLIKIEDIKNIEIDK